MKLKEEIEKVEKSNELRGTGWKISDSGGKFSKTISVPIEEDIYVALAIINGLQFLKFKEGMLGEISVMYQIDLFDELEYAENLLEFEDYFQENKYEISYIAKTRAVDDLKKKENKYLSYYLLFILAIALSLLFNQVLLSFLGFKKGGKIV